MLNKTTFLISIILVSIANSATWYISTSGDDNNNGTSENNAFASIQHGINRSNSGDIILVLPGTYVENINFLSKSIVIGSKYMDTGDTTYISQTVIDGNQNDSVCKIIYNGSTASLIGLTIKNGRAAEGAGILVYVNVDVTIDHCVISNNVGNGILGASQSHISILDSKFHNNTNYSTNNVHGTAIRSGGASFTIENTEIYANNKSSVLIDQSSALFHLNNCTIRNNVSVFEEAIFSWNGNLLLENSLIESNFTSGQGAGLRLDGGEQATGRAVIRNCIFKNNFAEDHGGAIAIWNVQSVIIDSTVIDSNTAGGWGGGISIGSIWDNPGRTIVIDNSVISNNLAEWNGGGLSVVSNTTDVYVKNTQFYQNTCFLSGDDTYGGNNGGAIFVESSEINLTECLFNNNYAENDGGGIIASQNASINIDKCTFVNNTASSGSGITLHSSSGNINSSIFWNDASEISYDANSNIVLKYSNFFSTVFGAGNINLNPNFVDAGNEDFHLQSNSPCINAGDPDIDGDGTTWENDHDDQDPDGTIVDMGAFYHANIISNITISSNPDTLSILNLNDTIAIAFNAQFNPATIEPNVELSSRENGSVPFEIFMNNNNSSFSISPLLKYPMTDTITITLNQGIISPDGYAFDYTNDGLLSDYNLKFLTPWLGDYNSDFSINFDDFIIFRDTWWERDQMDITPYELHPFSGTLPFVILQPDTNFAYDDLMTFIWMWNWSQAQNSVMRIDPFQEVGSTNSRIMFTPYYSNYDPSGQNLSIPIELELTINNPETVSSIEIILSYNPDELSFDDIQYTSPIDCNDCDWINLEYNTVESNQIIMNMVAFNKYRLLQPGINLLNSIKFQADGQDSITIEYSYDIRYDGEISLKGEVGSGNYTLKMVNALPEGFTLFQNYPNPFNPITTLRYELPERAHVQLKIYDILGREIRQLVYQEQDAGYKSVTWDGRDNDGRVMGAGMYLYRIHAGEFVRTKKMVLLK